MPEKINFSHLAVGDTVFAKAGKTGELMKIISIFLPDHLGRAIQMATRALKSIMSHPGVITFLVKA